jgi:4a-hydroxytetrahydrobiopterin dehydratase
LASFFPIIIAAFTPPCYLGKSEVEMADPRRLPDEEIQSELKALAGWELRDGRLRKQFTFRTFLRALVFVNSVAYLAESAGHHPDITINYNKVTLRLITHSEGALTDRDFALAQEIDAKLSTKLIIMPEEPSQPKNGA